MDQRTTGAAPGHHRQLSTRCLTTLTRTVLAENVTAASYGGAMGARRIWTSEELEAMSPNDRDAIVRAGFETDLAKVAPELLARARRKIEAHIAATEGTPTADR